MSHLEEGTLHALLDGEIPSSDLAPIQAHLAACAECRARLEDERGLFAEADALVDLLEVPASTGGARSKPVVSWRRISRLAWAASVFAAIGLGYYARGLRPISTPAKSSVESITPVHDTFSAITPASTGNADKPAPAAEPKTRPLQIEGAVGGRSTRTSFKRTAELGKTERKLPAERAEEVVAASASAVDSAAVRRVSPGAVAPASAAAPLPVAPPVAQGLTGRLRNDVVGARLESKSVLSLDEAAAEPITLPDAVRRLGGSLRLIDGLVPLRLEGRGVTVRVVYAVSQGELVLSQQLIDGKVDWRLIAPPGFPADSLARLKARVRE
jgi:hypothetical protein